MSWPMLPLRELAHVEHGWPFKSEFYTEPDDNGANRLVSIGNFAYEGGFRGAFKGYRGEYPPQYELSAGDLLLVMTCQTAEGEILGLPALVPGDGSTYLHNQRIGKLVLNDNRSLDARYAFYVALTRGFNRQLFLSASGTKILHTSPGRIEQVAIPVPPLPTQRAIAEVLGALDDKIAANRVVADASEVLAQAMYSCSRRRVELVPASRLLVPVLGGTPARDNEQHWSGGTPWVSAKDIVGALGGVVLRTEESISAEGVANSRAKPVPAGSVIMTARGTVGAVARLGVAASFNQSCYAFVPSAELPAACLYFLVKDAAVDALSVAHGSVFSTITMRSFDALSVPRFDAATMLSLEGQLSPLLELIVAKARESWHLANLRDMLLPHLMSGRITVREAEKQIGTVL